MPSVGGCKRLEKGLQGAWVAAKGCIGKMVTEAAAAHHSLSLLEAWQPRTEGMPLLSKLQALLPNHLKRHGGPKVPVIGSCAKAGVCSSIPDARSL